MKNMMLYINLYKRAIFLFLFLIISISGFGQKRLLEGIVVNPSGVYLENVKIAIAENPEEVVYTNTNGNFSISVSADEHLIFDYRNRDRKVLSVLEIEESKTIILGDRDTKLVNTGFGIKQIEEETASSVGSLSCENIEKITALNVGDLLFGQIPGLWAFQKAGVSPDDRAPSLNIRGLSTTQNGSILVLVDGVQRPINTVVPEEVESITVLRDAAAKARYGQYGANGVLLITTKRGNKGDIKFYATVEKGISSAIRLPKFLNAADYAKAENEARENDGMLPRYTQKEIEYFASGEYPQYFPNVDWVDETLGSSGSFSKYNLSFSGGSSSVNYYVSMNYQNDQGLYKYTDENADFSSQLNYDKFNLRVNLDIELTPTTSATIDIGGFVNTFQQPSTPGAGKRVQETTMFNEAQYSVQRQQAHNIVWDVFSLPSAAYPLRNADDSWGGSQIYAKNPVAQICDQGYDLNHVFSFAPALTVKQNLSVITKGLSAELYAAYYNRSDYWENKVKTFRYYEVIPVLNESGNIVDEIRNEGGQDSNLTPDRYSGDAQLTYYDIHGMLKYDKILGIHNIKSWVLLESGEQDLHGTNQVYRSNNLTGNVQYGYNNKYFLDGTLSYYGTNRIQQKSNRWGLFPAIAGAWIVSKEPFLKKLNFIDYLKIRSSYGIVGNGLVSIYDATSSIYGSGNSYLFGDNYQGVGGTKQIQIGIENKKFEKSKEINFGVDFQLWNKLTFTGELFHTKRENIFVPATGGYSAVIGILPSMVPEGEVENKGYDLNLTWKDKLGEFVYSFSCMFSQYKNKIINMNEEYRPYDYMRREGHSIGQYFGWESDGFYSSTDDIAKNPSSQFGVVTPGDIKYVDQNSDGYIDEFDQKPIGHSSFPDIYYSAGLNLEYKGFRLYALFQGTEGSSAYLSLSNVFWPLRGNDNISTWYKNYWSTENTENAELPRLSKESDNNYRVNDIWVRNKSFMKLRYAELSYSLPEKIFGNIGIHKAMLYVRGNNLFTIDRIKYVDPENTSATYPSLKTCNLGVKVEF